MAFTAGLSLTLVIADSTGPGDEESQRIETALVPAATESSSSFEFDAPLTTDANAALLVVADVGEAAAGPELTKNDGATIGTQPETPIAGIGEALDPILTDGSSSTSGPSTSGTQSPQTTGPRTTNSQSPTSPSTKASATNAPTTKAPTTNAPTTKAPTTKAPTTKPPTTQAPTTKPPATTAPRPANNGSGKFESMRNNDPLFNRYANVPSNQLSLNALTEPAPVADNGSNGDGNFRMACNYSHFSYDDPIVFPGQPGKSHFHMFFGNTAVDAHTTTNSLVNSGGGSCNGFELNRSGYWTPALMDGKGNAIVPDQIILYYKTKHPGQVQGMPQGLKMIAGNPTKESFTADYKLGWSCGGSGTSYNRSNRIPNNCGNDPVNAYIQFPFCWDGKNLDSSDHSSHMAYVNDNQNCPGSHPVRLPQISILLYFPAGNTNGWHLSSDRSNGFNTGPGATLHADWFGGWNDDAMDLWINGCMKRARNCSYGQTGTSRMFAKLNPFQNYPGNNVIPIPK